MQITDKILEILNGMASGSSPMLKTVMYESAFGSNVRLDRKETPAAILYLIEGFKVDVDRAFKHKIVDAEVFFCSRVDLNAKGEVIKGVMDSIEPLVDEFISQLLDEKSWNVSNIKAQSAYGKFDCNVAGFSLSFTVEDRQGTCV